MSKESVVIVGGGGREDALRWGFERSPHVGKATVVPASLNEKDLLNTCDSLKADLVFFGPEQPLVEGKADYLRAHNRGISVFGPGKDGAMLESSKLFAKSFMRRNNIPTAESGGFANHEFALRYALENLPVYIKADGLAGGKGAMDGSTADLAKYALEEIMLKKKFGPAGEHVVIQKKLKGEEASCMAFINSDSRLVIPMLYSQDHKKLLDGDVGPNTGGMGAYAPTRLVDPVLAEDVYWKILSRTCNGLDEEQISYTGALYPGLMIDDKKPSVLEYNARMGDPETQVIVPMMSDLYETVMATHLGVKNFRPTWRRGYAACVVLAANGYPESAEKGKQIHGLDKFGRALCHDVIVFHAGTRKDGDNYYTNGGRVLNVVAQGSTLAIALEKIYSAIGRENNGIYFDGMHYRKDIGQREFQRYAA